ncbi:STAS/SEC14 domain-containing protein [Egicoccus sp. AB-alg2]|uniref:STAS/SEC14 domain-containing protein n=1 Tax=Egicoccus sp. AB-alg2 TaxID=3242693 RepID=UPI00359E4F83
MLGYAVEGRLERDDVERMQAEMRVAMEQHGDLRLLVRIDGMDDLTPEAVWQDLEMTPDYLRRVERLAVVGDERWHRWATTAARPFADAAHFPPEEQNDAWAWVRGEDADGA